MNSEPLKNLRGLFKRPLPTPWKFGPPSPLNFRCPPLGGGGYGYFLELHNAYLTGYTEGGGGTFLGSSLHTCGKTVGDFRIHTCKAICADHQLIHPAMQAKDMNEPYVENKALCMQMLGDG